MSHNQVMKELSQSSQEIIEAYDNGYRCTRDGHIILNNKCVSLIRKEFKGTGQVTPTPYYLFIPEYRGSNENPIRVHRFVAYCKYGLEAFSHLVRHHNNNSLDNSWDNLLLGTTRDNTLDIPVEIRRERAQRAGLKKRKLTEEDEKNIMKLRKLNKDKWTYDLLADRYGVCRKTIQNILARRNTFCS
jgi:hypothetical protein